MAYPLWVLNIRIRCPHRFFIGICHPVSCQKSPISALKIEHSKPDKEIGYIDNETDSSASDSENDSWEDIIMHMHSMQRLGQNEVPSSSICYFFVWLLMLNLSSIPSFDFDATIFHTRFRNTKCAPILSRNSNVLIFMMFSPSQLSYCCNCSLSLYTYMTPTGT